LKAAERKWQVSFAGFLCRMIELHPLEIKWPPPIAFLTFHLPTPNAMPCHAINSMRRFVERSDEENSIDATVVLAVVSDLGPPPPDHFPTSRYET